MKIHLPNSAFIGNIDPFLKSFDPSNPDRLEITANEKWISVHPVVLSMIAALGVELAPSQISCPRIVASSGHYLDRMGLFRFLGIDSGMRVSEHDPSGRFVPLTQIRTSEELGNFLTEIIPLLHLEPAHAQPIRYVISELVRNVIEHADSPVGALVCAQYYPTQERMRLGIADIGIGIKRSINRSYEASTDLEAIKLALMPGITGTTRREGGSEFNAGAGLFFTKSIAHVGRDFFMLYSGSGFYKLLLRDINKQLALMGDPSLDRHSESDAMPYWPGTVVGIDISLNATHEFRALLDLIRTTYIHSVRARRRERLRAPRFI